MLRRFFGLDDDYVRPVPSRPWRTDSLIAALLTLLSLATLMYLHEIEEARPYAPVWPSVVSIVTAGVLIALRRRFPIAVLMLVSGVHFIITGVYLPAIASTGAMQVLYFLGLYTAMAYARRRDTLMLATIAVLVAMLAWLVISDSYSRAVFPTEFTPSLWYYVSTVLINLAYFGAALWLGRNAWLQARSADELARSRDLVAEQSAQLARQAVLAERLRIARDLHDSVAHHISLIGVQTAAARRAMASRPETAAQAMEEVEEMSRNAVSELRGLLGSLRDVTTDAGGTNSVDAIRALCEEADGDTLRVTCQLVGDVDGLDDLSPTQATSLLRVAQEALTNVRRHSTATEARVVIRNGDGGIELEVTDNGHPVPNTAGSGLGLVGMRERAAALGGTVEVGPRSKQGYRVHLRIPTRKATP